MYGINFPVSYVEYRQRVLASHPYRIRKIANRRLRIKGRWREAFGNWGGSCVSRIGPEDVANIPRFVPSLFDEALGRRTRYRAPKRSLAWTAACNQESFGLLSSATFSNESVTVVEFTLALSGFSVGQSPLASSKGNSANGDEDKAACIYQTAVARNQRRRRTPGLPRYRGAA